MTLDDIYNLLTSGELRQHPLFASGLKDEDKEKVNQFITAGLTDLYTRFPLKTDRLVLVMDEVETVYPLVKGSPHIDEGLIPYTGDLLKVLEVLDEGECTVPLNNGNEPCGVFTSSTNVLQIPQPVDGDMLYITYQANHKDISTGIELTANLVPALCAYVGYRLYSGDTNQQSSVKANQLLSEYERQCINQEIFGLVNKDDVTTLTSFCTGGWV